MKSKLNLAVGLLHVAAVLVTGQPPPSDELPASDFEMRCGWFSNPTPANIWFYDREAEWTIGVQGGYQVPGDWPWPKFKSRQWVRTNGSHGYGCVCMRLRVDRETHQVLEIMRAQASLWKHAARIGRRRNGSSTELVETLKQRCHREANDSVRHPEE